MGCFVRAVYSLNISLDRLNVQLKIRTLFCREYIMLFIFDYVGSHSYHQPGWSQHSLARYSCVALAPYGVHTVPTQCQMV